MRQERRTGDRLKGSRPLVSVVDEVKALAVSGFLNKQVGAELGISEITLKAHRGQLMRKMQADSLAGLVTIAAKLGLRTTNATKDTGDGQ